MVWDICGYQVRPGEKKQIFIRPAGDGFEIPATAICGADSDEPGESAGSGGGRLPGGAGSAAGRLAESGGEGLTGSAGSSSAGLKTVVVTAGVHCDEYPGVAAVIRLAKAIDPVRLRGRLLLVHAVNASGFQQGGIRVVPEDGGNLNAVYPGRPDGSLSERIADYFVREILSQADFVADLHSGSVGEPLTPCLFFPKAPAVRQASLKAAMALSIPLLIESTATTGEYSYAANAMNIPALLLERGHSGLCRPEWVDGHERDIRLLLAHLGLYEMSLWPDYHRLDLKEGTGRAGEKTVFTKNVYLSAQQDGLWYPAIEEGQKVKRGQLLGRMENVFGDELAEYRAEQDGLVFYYTAGLSVRKGDALAAYGQSEA